MDLSTSRTWAEINLKSLEKNIEILRTQISNQTKFLAVVKANAYGHGLIEISKKLEQLKIDMFGVATVEEALKLRENQIKTPILVLGQSSPELFDLISDNEITITIENIEIARNFSNFARNKKIKIHIKIDTGMGRLGFFWPEDEKSKKKLSSEIKKISFFPGLKIEGIFTHLAKTTDKHFTNNQIKKFKEAIEYLNNLGLKFNIIHACASSATLNYPSAHFDMCRFGLVMYGYESTENGNKNGKLNRRFVLYYIHVTKDKNSYSKSRMNGQVLGQKYVVKDISKENPQIVTDIHETNYRLSGYKYPRFIHMISNKKIKSVKISKKLHNKSSTYLKRLLKLAPHIKRFDPQLGSSPAYITVPIANKGIVSYIYETEASYSKNLKQKYADKYIKALNKVNLTFKH